MVHGAPIRRSVDRRQALRSDNRPMRVLIISGKLTDRTAAAVYGTVSHHAVHYGHTISFGVLRR